MQINIQKQKYKRVVNGAFSYAVTMLLALGIGTAAEKIKAASASAPADSFRNQDLVFADEIVLQNDLIRIGISPSVGRIVQFGEKNGPNLLWLNQRRGRKVYRKNGRWGNCGGDKVWATMQCYWPELFGREWPPNPALDGSEWSVIQKENLRLIIESPFCAKLKIKFRREIEVLADKPEVRITNIVTRLEDSPYPVMAWPVTQVKQPEFCLMGISQDVPKIQKSFIQMRDEKAITTLLDGDRILRVDRQHGKSVKVGGYGRWLAAVYPKYIFKQSAEYYPQLCYPDKSSLQVFWYKGTELPFRNEYDKWSDVFVELEALSPAFTLKKRQNFTHVVHWKLLTRPLKLQPDELAEYCRKN